ncbi:MAG: hypothetical protein H0V44_12680 [Planctomycetes bacterium]|nr:hypothetical protein [Planctomycetota bacterium]
MRAKPSKRVLARSGPAWGPAVTRIRPGGAASIPSTWGYLRLRRERYDTRSLRAWSRRIRAQRWTSTHVFFKHEDQARGPRYAQRLMELMAWNAGAIGVSPRAT